MFAVLALIVEACGSSDYDAPSVIEPDEDRMVVLGLNVIVGETQGRIT